METKELKGYRLTDCQALSNALSVVAKCSLCALSLLLAEDVSCSRGLVSKLSIKCSNDACGAIFHVCDPYSPKSKHVKRRSVLAMRMVGHGRSGLETFCAVTDMLPPIAHASYSEHCAVIRAESEAVAIASQDSASA